MGLPTSTTVPPLVAQPVGLSAEAFDLICDGVRGLWKRLVARDARANRHPLLLSYDVHPGPTGPVLIEINTNAGGVLAAIEAARSVNQCCADWEQRLLRQRLLQLLRRDLIGQGGFLVIADESLEQQALLPEMHALAELVRPDVEDVVVADTQQLEYTQGRLRHAGRPVDRLYWRSTDFAIGAPHHAHIRHAWAEGSTVVAPSPDAWAAIADKRLFAELSEQALLAESLRTGLRFRMAETVAFDTQSPSEWAAQRKNWVFKPAVGHASKGVYVGKKISRRKLDSLVGADYLAQRYAPHPVLARDTGKWKYDLRFYADRGEVIGVSARVFAGQVMGMGRPGSGMAGVQIDDRCCLVRSMLA